MQFRLVLAAAVAANVAMAMDRAAAVEMSYAITQMYASVEVPPPTAERITVCYGFVCRRRAHLDFTQADHKSLSDILNKGKASPEAERRAQKLDTEARTLARLLHVDTKSLWPAVIDELSVGKGYEAALGAALGDDLEAPTHPSAPMRWAGAPMDAGDPALPEGVEALALHVRAPQELARRLAQIGVIARADAGK